MILHFHKLSGDISYVMMRLLFLLIEISIASKPLQVKPLTDVASKCRFCLQFAQYRASRWGFTSNYGEISNMLDISRRSPSRPMIPVTVRWSVNAQSIGHTHRVIGSRIAGRISRRCHTKVAKWVWLLTILTPIPQTLNRMQSTLTNVTPPHYLIHLVPLAHDTCISNVP